MFGCGRADFNKNSAMLIMHAWFLSYLWQGPIPTTQQRNQQYFVVANTLLSSSEFKETSKPIELIKHEQDVKNGQLNATNESSHISQEVSELADKLDVMIILIINYIESNLTKSDTYIEGYYY